MEKQYLERLMKPSAEFDLVIGGFVKRSEDGTILYETVFSERECRNVTSQDVCEMIEEHSTDYVWGKRFRTQILRENRVLFGEKLDLAEDTLFVCSVIAHCRNIFIFAKSGYWYYDHPGSLSGVNSQFVRKLQTANSLAAEKMRERFPEVAVSLTWKKRLFSTYHIAIPCILNGRFSVREKYGMLKEIYKEEEYRAFLREPGVYMPGDSRKFVWAISRKSPIWAILLFQISKARRIFRGQKEKR